MSPARARIRLLGAAALTLAGTVALVWLSAAPLPPATDGAMGLVRLSWRIREDAGESGCRRPTPEELDRLPPHMRDPEACMGRGTAWRLVVSIDGTPVVSDTLEPAGARGDRPVFVLREMPVSPGMHRLSVDFDPLDPSAPSGLRLRRSVDVAPGEVVLVTYDPEAGRIVVRERPSPS